MKSLRLIVLPLLVVLIVVFVQKGVVGSKQQPPCYSYCCFGYVHVPVTVQLRRRSHCCCYQTSRILPFKFIPRHQSWNHCYSTLINRRATTTTTTTTSHQNFGLRKTMTATMTATDITTTSPPQLEPNGLVLTSLPSPPNELLSTMIPSTMRCFVYGKEPGTIMEQIRDTPTTLDNIKKDNVVLVRVYAVGLNPVDAKNVIGDKLPRSLPWLRNYLVRRFVQNKIIGFDYAGVIVQIPNNNKNNNNNNNQTTTTTATNSHYQQESQPQPHYKVGDYVFGTVPPFHGTLAEYIVAPIDQLYYIPTTTTKSTKKGENDDVVMIPPSSSPTSTLFWNKNSIHNEMEEDHETNNLNDNGMQKEKQQLGMKEPAVVLCGEDSMMKYVKQPLLTFIQAAAMPLVWLTVYQSLHTQMTKSKNATSILIIGGSGGTGHVTIQMSKYYWKAKYITVICSKKNATFCYNCGATHVVPYDDNSDDNTNNMDPTKNLMKKLLQQPGAPYDIVMDCVTSDDPRDTATFSYPKLLQQYSVYQQGNGDGIDGGDEQQQQPEQYRQKLLNENYIYRRLGGPPLDWVKAGIERVTGATSVWRRTPHEKLFWIRFPKTSNQLQVLHDTILKKEQKRNVDDDDDNVSSIPPPVIEPGNVFSFTKRGIEQAFQVLQSRRVRGKVVIKIVDE